MTTNASQSDGWHEVQLRDVIGDCGIFVDGDWVESKDQDPNGNVRLIQLADIGDGRYINKSKRFLTSEKAKELKCTYLQPGDILIARMPDPLGRACIFPGDEKPCITVVDVCVLRPDTKLVDSGWLQWTINSPGFRVRLNRFISGTTRQRISRKNLESIQLKLPPLTQQKRIAAILNKANTLREKRRQTIAKLTTLQQSVFLDMFGDPMNSNYEVRPLVDVCSKITDGAHLTPTYASEGMPFLRVTDIQDDKINWMSVKRIPLEEHEQLTKRCKAEMGDVLYSKNGTVGIPRLIDWEQPFSFFVSLALLKPDRSKLLGGYLESFLQTPFALRQAVGHTKTGTVSNLHLIEIKKIRLPIPSLDLQQRWLEVRAKIEAHKAKLIRALVKTDNVFYSIQQRAFNGELFADNPELIEVT